MIKLERWGEHKQPVCVSQEEEDGSDDDSSSSMTVDELLVPPPHTATRPTVGEEDSDRDSDPAFVSPIDEVKAVRQPPVLTTANLHAASRSVRVIFFKLLQQVQGLKLAH